MSSDHRWWTALALMLVLVASHGCHDVTINLVSDRGPGAGDAAALVDGAISGDAARGPDAAAGDARVPHVPVLCGGTPCACDDGSDGDGDGLIDGLDPECTGPFDDDEQSFATGLPLGGVSGCRDCFWDDNAGSGDDKCRYPAECLLGVSTTGKGSCGTCVVEQACINTCAERTPNGCDCFGCCDVTREDGSIVQISLSETCSLTALDDTQACPRCAQSDACRNPCGRCELCPGRRASDLPADCAVATTPGYACDEGEPVCSSSQPCSDTRYCQLGCCLPTLF